MAATGCRCWSRYAKSSYRKFSGVSAERSPILTENSAISSRLLFLAEDEHSEWLRPIALRLDARSQFAMTQAEIELFVKSRRRQTFDDHAFLIPITLQNRIYSNIRDQAESRRPLTSRAGRGESSCGAKNRFASHAQKDHAERIVQTLEYLRYASGQGFSRSRLLHHTLHFRKISAWILPRALIATKPRNLGIYRIPTCSG
jgi:hypothetical protein